MNVGRKIFIAIRRLVRVIIRTEISGGFCQKEDGLHIRFEDLNPVLEDPFCIGCLKYLGLKDWSTHSELLRTYNPRRYSRVQARLEEGNT